MGREKEKGGAAPPPSPSPIRTRGEEACGPPWLPFSLSTKAHMAHYFSPGGVPITLRYSDFLRNHPEHFRCPNIVV